MTFGPELQKNKHKLENNTTKMQKCLTTFGRISECAVVFLSDSKGAKVCKACSSRQELSREYLLVKCGFDTTENVPLKVCQ